MTDTVIILVFFALLGVWTIHVLDIARDLIFGGRKVVTDPQITPHSLWLYKDKSYRVIAVFDNELTQFEDKWYPTVRYEAEPHVGLSFNRALPDFQHKFRPRSY